MVMTVYKIILSKILFNFFLFSLIDISVRQLLEILQSYEIDVGKKISIDWLCPICQWEY